MGGHHTGTAAGGFKCGNVLKSVAVEDSEIDLATLFG
jgi:hypothetical protein